MIPSAMPYHLWRIPAAKSALAIVLFALAPCVRGDFFVSPTGSDKSPGSKSKPFASLERARDAVRELRREKRFPKRGLVIWLREGIYVRTNALELSAEDSATPDAPIIWRAF